MDELIAESNGGGPMNRPRRPTRPKPRPPSLSHIRARTDDFRTHVATSLLGLLFLAFIVASFWETTLALALLVPITAIGKQLAKLNEGGKDEK